MDTLEQFLSGGLEAYKTYADQQTAKLQANTQAQVAASQTGASVINSTNMKQIITYAVLGVVAIVVIVVIFKRK